MHKITKKTYMK